MLRQGLVCLLMVCCCAPARAALQTELVASGFSRPVYAVSPPGDASRLFILEQHTGRIRIIDLASGTVNSTPFMIATNLATGFEQGLLGMAFHPDYASNGYFFLYQTSRGGAGRSEISRYRVEGDPATSNAGDRSTRQILLAFNQPEENHNGGWIGFGPDGYLYIATGDGGGANDRHGTIGNSQNRANLLGKILRIDVDNEVPYSIPDGNPYKGSASMANEIWAFGLRNPWRCSFDRVTGHLWMGDVGQVDREEINVIPAGAGGLNFGWRPREGFIQTPAFPNETPVTPAVNPVFDYVHTLGLSVTGGYVYRGNRVPELYGKYIFGDYTTTRFWELTPDATGTNGTVREVTAQVNPAPRRINNLSSFGEDGAGEIYICDLLDGEIFRITSDAPPGIQLQAGRNETGDLAVTFRANAGQAYVLESAAGFEQPLAWTEFSPVPAGEARSVTLTAPVTGTGRYFRLRAQ